MLQASFIKFLLDTRIRLIVLIILLVLLAWQIAVLFWQIYPLPDMSHIAITQSNVQSAQQNDNQPSRQAQAKAIVESYLFGKAEVAKVAAEVIEEAPETKLAYKLRGIYYSDDSSFSSAIVEVKPNDSKHYYTEDELAENITVSSIAQDHILIDRYGKIERLNLQKPVFSAKDNSARSLASNNGQVSTRLLQSYKKRYVSNPLALAKRFQAVPVQENGRNIGFRLKALRGESLLKKLNFDENDVFTKINGISLDKPFQALDALKSLTTANSVSVTILRNGSEQTMDFSL